MPRIAILVCSVLAAGSVLAVPEKSVGEIIDLHLEARGGEDNLRSI